MKYIEVVDLAPGRSPVAAETCYRSAQALEAGQILFLPRYQFPVPGSYQALFSPDIVHRHSPNVSYSPATRKLYGTARMGPSLSLLQEMMAGFADFARKTVTRLLPIYRTGLVPARVSFRPIEIETRPMPWRKDVRRLHIDAFPSTPIQGNRILRLFCNVNPAGQTHLWRIGEPFEQTAKRFLPFIRPPFPLSSVALMLTSTTKSRRTFYDHIMLCLQDRMKRDQRYQAEAEQVKVEFPAGSTWLAFTDQVSHATIREQYQLEQTFLLDANRLHDQSTAPLNVLEKLAGRKLV
ncbi:MAG: Kdo hydroxylase family protein [Verrucomicrobia bacterium]|nr:Kdo hydroxylase family protein [Verrucomicrobiota bacterium]MBV8274091.1 Kdo hydroxylase family protein [Verrucomicrobiota bacterium]